MQAKTEKIIGLMCLIIAGLLVVGEAAFLAIPAMAELADKDLAGHVRTLLFILVLFALGLYLCRVRIVKTRVLLSCLVVSAFLLMPLLYIRVVLHIMQEHGPIASLAGLRIVLVIITVFSIVLPYISRKRIINYQTKRMTRSFESTYFTLYILGLACTLMPSISAALSVLLGLPESDLYSFVALTYLTGPVWSVWWYILSSKAEQKGLSKE